MEKQKLQRKIKLYIVLHGNNVKFLQDMHNKNSNCEKCRAMNGGICQTAHNLYTIGYDLHSKKILMMGDNKAKIREKIYFWQEEERIKVQDDFGRIPAWFHGGDYLTVCFGFLNTNESEN